MQMEFVKFKNMWFMFIMLLVLPAFIACNAGKSGNQNQNQNQNNAGEENPGGQSDETPAETEKVFPHEIQDFGGYTFRTLAAEEKAGNNLYYEDLEIEEANGEVYNDALYERKMKIEEQFNIKFHSINKGDISSDVKKSVNAGSDDYDLILPRFNTAYNLIPQCVDLMPLKNLSFGESWWDKNCTEDMSIAKRLYIITGDAFTKHYDGIELLVFNKKILADSGLQSPYPLVKDGKWTLEAMGEMAKAVQRDLNGDGVMDREDLWGLAFQSDIIGGVINAAGLRFIYKDNDDIPYTMPNTERMNAAIDKFLAFYNEYTWDALRDGKGAHLSAFWLFPSGNALFNGIMLHYIPWQFRDMEYDFGILPLPKLDEAQEKYYSTVNPYHSFSFMMPKSVEDPEKSAYIMDAMGFYGEKIIKPAYYDVCLTRKYTRDDESNDMLDIIFSSTIYDLGIYANFGNIYSSTESVITKGANTYVSEYEKIQAKVQAAIDKFLAGIGE